jgi:hypothetical protein
MVSTVSEPRGDRPCAATIGIAVRVERQRDQYGGQDSIATPENAVGGPFVERSLQTLDTFLERVPPPVGHVEQAPRLGS